MSKSNKEKQRLLNIRNYKNGKEELLNSSIKIKLRIGFFNDVHISFCLNGDNTCNLKLGKYTKHLKKRVKIFYHEHLHELIKYKTEFKSIITEKLQKSLIEISKKNNNYDWNINAFIKFNQVNPDLISITFIVKNLNFKGIIVFSEYNDIVLNFDELNHELITKPNEIKDKINKINDQQVYISLEPSYPDSKKTLFYKNIIKIKLFRQKLKSEYNINFEKRTAFSMLVGNENYYRILKKNNKKEINFEKTNLDNNLDILRTFISQYYFGEPSEYKEILESDDFESIVNYVGLINY